MDLHKATLDDYKAIRTLYASAFPRNERAPFFFLKGRARQNRATMLVAEECGAFVGFTYTVCYKDSVYLFYFAVDADKRGNGNGSEILRLLKTYYAGKKIFLAREPLDDTAKNSQERIDRRNFYVHNGFIDLPFQIKEASVIYDLMSTSEDFNHSDYNALIKNWAGKFMLCFVRMEVVAK